MGGKVRVQLSENEAKALREFLREYGSTHYVVGKLSEALWSVVDQLDDKLGDDEQ